MRLPGSSILRCVLVALFATAAAWMADSSVKVDSTIHFTFKPIPFVLDSSETKERHAPETMAGGIAVFDYNNDGHLDIFFANGADIGTLKKDAPKYSNKLFEGDGKGNFRDVTEKAGLAGIGYDNGVVIGDYDNDGYKDIFVGGVHGNRLYHNNGNGTFTDVTEKAGFNKPDREYGPLWSVGGAWIDVNNDGLLDLFVVNYLSWDPAKEPTCEGAGKRDYCHPKFYGKTPNQLYLNNGDGTFRDVSKEWGIREKPGKGMGIGVADYDLDGRLDIFVPCDKLYNLLFHRTTGNTYKEDAFTANVALRDDGQFISGMGTDFRDLDNDGYPDIILVALDDETFPLFHNTGKGDFEDITISSGMARSTIAMSGYSPTAADFDNDGWKDIFVTRGHVQSLDAAPRIQVEQPNTVFRNQGKMRFQPLTAEAGLTAQPPRRHRGSAIGDFNGDGKLDVVVSAISGPSEIWMNDSPGNAHWLELQLEGTKSNRDAIGARVKVVTKGATQYNHVAFAAGYASSSAGPLHFGLGADAVADTVEIRWPSGIVQTLHDVGGDRVMKVKEPAK